MKMHIGVTPRKFLLPIVIVVVALGGFAILKASRPAPPPMEAKERVWRVEAQRVETSYHHPEFTLYGRIEAPDRWRAAAPVAGRIGQVLVRDGALVEAGQPLLAMDPRDLEPRLTQARADLEREQIRYRQDLQALEREQELVVLGEAKVRRAERLTSDRLGSERDLDQAREELARARLALMQREQAVAEHPARLAQAQARLAEAERDWQRASVVAPFAARVGRVEVAAGDQVGGGQTLLTLLPLDGLYLKARVPNRHVPLLQQSLTRDEPLYATLEHAGQGHTARLERLGGEAELRGVDAWLSLNADLSIAVGTLASATLRGPKLEAVALPFSALHGGERVYLVEEGRLRGVSVTLLGERRNGGQVEMLVASSEALQDGVLVMTSHLPNAIDGLRVEAVGE